MTVSLFGSLQQIVNSESVSPLVGIRRHLSWQVRRMLGRFPCELTISHSRLLAEEPTGVCALVNAMGMYDYNNMHLLLTALGRGPATFVDVGANIGPYTIVASECKTARVVSIEPHPATFAMLRRNVQVNERGNILCLNLALSDRDGQAHLTDVPGSSTNRVVGNVAGDEGWISVPCRTLDGVCAERDIAPDVVKIDVEGHEIQVIEGFQENLRGVSLLLIEGGERPEVRSIMARNGLAGPLYVHYRKKALLSTPQRRVEDPVYVSASFLEDLRLWGIRGRQPAREEVS